jgi:phospholipid/cholesterol/gamma-HCH transport system substrate-binding protein
MRSRSGSDVRLGGLVLITVAALMLLSFTGILRGLLFGGAGDTKTIRATFASAQQLHPGDLVRVGGVDVGKVDTITLGPGGRSATVTMQVKTSVGALHKDARADVRWRLLLGANFYVRLDPGTDRAGELGERPIPLRQTGGEQELEDITSIFQGPAEQGLRTLPRELAKTLRSPQPLSAPLQALADVSPALARGLRDVRGTDPGDDLPNVLKNAAIAVKALDTPQNELRAVVQGAAATLGTTAARQADLRSTIAQAPGVQREATLTLGRLDRTLGLADTIVAKLQKPAPEVGPTLAALQPTVVRADRLARSAVPLLRSLRPAVSSLARAARVGKPLLDELVPSLDRLNAVILPYLARKDPGTGHTVSEMIGPTLGGLGAGAAGQQDQNGHFIRFPATVGNNPLYLPCSIYLNNPDKADQLIACQSLQEATKTLLSYNPLGPAPGTAPDPGTP